jgi:cytochrome c biogenesis protein CcmG/thiol:disulfide interchange protein DsbE
MMHGVRTALTLAAAGLLMTAALGAADKVRMAPSVELRLADGAIVRPADFKGKVVLVDFWASWCPPCKTSFPELDTLYQSYRGRGLEVLAVNLDERRKDADAFLADHPHVMPVAFDPKGDSALAFAVHGMPSSIVIDRGGNIRFTHMGYSGKVLDSYREEINLLLSER